MNRLRNSTLLLASLLLFTAASFAQNNPSAGILPFSTQVGGAVDSIDLATSNILLRVPVRSKPGKIPFSYSLIGNSGVYNSSGAWAGEVFALVGQPMIGTFGSTLGGTKTTVSCGSNSNTKWTNIYTVDPTGASHPFPNSYQSGPGG